jgi:peptidyl-prolyl cis-trans isomerase B (cyclophilin B)
VRKMRRHTIILTIALAVGATTSGLSAVPQPLPIPAIPILVIETAKGTFEMELFRADAPKSVDHLVGLVRKGFYRGLRVHRVTATLMQMGEPMSRDVSRRDYWGGGGSGSPIGVAEFSKKRTHQRGTVGMAHSGDARYADSQFYILKTATPSYDGKYVIVGQVLKGMEVVDKLVVLDVIKNAYLKGEGPK